MISPSFLEYAGLDARDYMEEPPKDQDWLAVLTRRANRPGGRRKAPMSRKRGFYKWIREVGLE